MSLKELESQHKHISIDLFKTLGKPLMFAEVGKNGKLYQYFIKSMCSLCFFNMTGLPGKI